MHFMMIVKGKGDCEMGNKPTDEFRAAIWNYTQELRKAGALVELSRLQPTSQAARVRLSGRNPIVTDGPFAETKEMIGGYWVIDAKSMREAVDWAKRVPAPEGEAMEMEVEIRQFQGLEEFFPLKTPSRALSAGE
jgi:hypothetical protein